MTPLKRLCDIVKDYFFNMHGTIKASIKEVSNTVPELPEPVRERDEHNRRWVFSHYAELLSHYENKYIAIADRKVIAYGRDPEKVLKEVEKRPDQQKVIFMYMDPKDRIYAGG